jgi:hypothetical protein
VNIDDWYAGRGPDPREGSIGHGRSERDLRAGALRSAPEWVRRRLGGAASPPADDVTPPAFWGVWEHNADGSYRQLAGPPGPPPPKGDAAGHGRSGGSPNVWWDPRSPHRPGALTTRVWLVACHGDADRLHIGRGKWETIDKRAFGTAEALNKEAIVPIQLGHRGFPLARLGRGLVAHDTDVGLVLRWTPDMDLIGHRDAVAKIEAGWGCSVSFRHKLRDVGSLPSVDVIRRAILAHVAIVEKPAYRGAVALVFRNSRNADEREIEEQLARVVREAEFKAKRTWSRK